MTKIISSAEIPVAKAWLHDVFVWGGLASSPKRAISMKNYRYMYGLSPDNFRNPAADSTANTKYRDAAKVICGMIKDRTVETQRFKAFDDAINTISACNFNPDLSSTNVRGGSTKISAKMACRFIAWFCEQNNLVYNNNNTSIYEMAEIINGTTIGKVLWNDYLFARGNIPEKRPADTDDDNDAVPQPQAQPASQPASQPDPQPAAQPAAQQAAPAAQSGKSGPAGHTLYRSNAGGILSPQKVTNISKQYGNVYWIGGEFTKANGTTKPKLHVKPQGAKAPLKVNYNSGQGYNDCILYFPDEASAKAFLLKADINKPSTVAALGVKKVSEDKGGYVEVSTEFGNAYIKASKLHEEVQEDLTEDNEEKLDYNHREAAQAYFDGFFRD